MILLPGDGEEMGDEEALKTARKDAGGSNEALLRMLSLKIKIRYLGAEAE